MTLRTALILAAGRGERLRPLTDHTPKPLLPYQGIPLITHHIQRLASAGFTRIIINQAYLGDQIRRYLKNGDAFGVTIDYSLEPPGALEAGGGIIYALPLLGAEPFLMVSADIVTDYPFQRLHPPPQSLAHFVLVPAKTSHKGDFDLSPEGLLLAEKRLYTFGSIACFHPDFFQDRTWQNLRFARLIYPRLPHPSVTGELYTGLLNDMGTLPTGTHPRGIDRRV